MALLKTAWANLQDGLGNRFSWSHVKAIFYNYAEHKLLSTKLDEMDALIDEKIAKAMMSNVQVNDQTKVPTSALAYSMSQEISQNEQNIATLNSKFPDDKSYFTAVIPRVKDITSGSDQPTLRIDIEYMIQTKGIKSGEYGFSSTQYTDLPASAPEWGYVKYFQHADNYVTVMVFPDGLTGGILLNQFVLGQNQWNTTWKKLELSETS